MNTVSGKLIERTWNRLNEATPEDLQAAVERMMAEQPFLAAYLLAVEDVHLPEAERGQVILIALFLWEVMSAGRPPLRSVSQEEIEAAEEANIRFLERLESGSEMDYLDSVQELLDTYNQGPLLQAVIEAIMSEHGEDPDAAPEGVGMALLHLKTVLDCLDQSAPED